MHLKSNLVRIIWRKPRRQRLRLVIGVIGLAAVLTACGSSNSKSSSNTSADKTGTSTGLQATGTPIKVGVICSCSGIYGSHPLTAEVVYKDWVNTVNKAGGIVGHPIKLIIYDDAAVPGTSISDIHTLISDHVAAIFDESLVDEPWASLVQTAAIPVIGGNLSESTFNSNPDFYPEGQTNNSMAASAVITAKSSGAANFGIFYCVEAATCSQGASLAKAAGQKVNLPTSYSVAASATAPNYTAQCVAAEQKHVAALFLLLSSPQVQLVGKSCSEQGYNPTYVTEGEGFGPVLETSVGIDKSLWSEYNNIPFWADTPAVHAMNAAIDKYSPGLQKMSDYTEQALGGWASGLLLQDAIKAGGLGSSTVPTAAEVVKGLHLLKNDTLEGMSPPLTFVSGESHSVDCWFTARLQNGVPRLVNGGKLTCEDGGSS